MHGDTGAAPAVDELERNRTLMRSSLSVVLLLVYATGVGACATMPTADAESDAAPIHARPATGLTIDGQLIEAPWAEAEWVQLGHFSVRQPQGEAERARWWAVTGFKAPVEQLAQRVEAALLWNGKGLYVGMRAQDRDVQGNKRRRDDWLWLEDVLEVFLAGSNEANQRHYEFQINPTGTQFVHRTEGAVSRPAPEGFQPPLMFDAAVYVAGSANESATGDEGYSAEWFFPWGQLVKADITPVSTGFEAGAQVGYVRFASWDLSAFSMLRVQRLTPPGGSNPHETRFYRPIVLADAPPHRLPRKREP